MLASALVEDGVLKICELDINFFILIPLYQTYKPAEKRVVNWLA